MEKSQKLEKIEKLKKNGYTLDIGDNTHYGCIATGGIQCDICDEYLSANFIYNKKSSKSICDGCLNLFHGDYKIKKILITSGGTKEYIDEVRVLTNISTGKLGALIAQEFDSYNNSSSREMRLHPVPLYDIHFVYVKGSEIPLAWDKKNLHLYEVIDVQSVYNVMKKLVPDMDVVIHPMAVSDFGFTRIDTKLKSNDPESFIESLKNRIYQTPKILSFIKKWNPNCFLISFKFENNITNDELIDIAYKSLKSNNCDLVIANDKAEMKKQMKHISYFINKNKEIKQIEDKENIAKEIIKYI